MQLTTIELSKNDTKKATTFKRPESFIKSSEKMSEMTSEKILELISKNKHISSKKIAEILNLAPRTVKEK